eukprot:GHVP01038118.1.p1 GENE.GHVP01038118.1~~GHVP01038118.1.p1  ORF type:complete len:1100 (-),score=177.93 GHVP01038118.1:643-3942(-)
MALDDNKEFSYEVRSSFATYWKIVHRPICILQILDKVEAGTYKDVKEFVSDWLLLQYNIGLVYMPNTLLHKRATYLLDQIWTFCEILLHFSDFEGLYQQLVDSGYLKPKKAKQNPNSPVRDLNNRTNENGQLKKSAPHDHLSQLIGIHGLEMPHRYGWNFLRRKSACIRQCSRHALVQTLRNFENKNLDVTDAKWPINFFSRFERCSVCEGLISSRKSAPRTLFANRCRKCHAMTHFKCDEYIPKVSENSQLFSKNFLCVYCRFCTYCQKFIHETISDQQKVCLMCVVCARTSHLECSYKSLTFQDTSSFKTVSWTMIGNSGSYICPPCRSSVKDSCDFDGYENVAKFPITKDPRINSMVQFILQQREKQLTTTILSELFMRLSNPVPGMLWQQQGTSPANKNIYTLLRHPSVWKAVSEFLSISSKLWSSNRPFIWLEASHKVACPLGICKSPVNSPCKSPPGMHQIDPLEHMAIVLLQNQFAQTQTQTSSEDYLVLARLYFEIRKYFYPYLYEAYNSPKSKVSESVPEFKYEKEKVISEKLISLRTPTLELDSLLCETCGFPDLSQFGSEGALLMDGKKIIHKMCHMKPEVSETTKFVCFICDGRNESSASHEYISCLCSNFSCHIKCLIQFVGTYDPHGDQKTTSLVFGWLSQVKLDCRKFSIRCSDCKNISQYKSFRQPEESPIVENAEVSWEAAKFLKLFDEKIETLLKFQPTPKPISYSTSFLLSTNIVILSCGTHLHMDDTVDHPMVEMTAISWLPFRDPDTVYLVMSTYLGVNNVAVKVYNSLGSQEESLTCTMEDCKELLFIENWGIAFGLYLEEVVDHRIRILQKQISENLLQNSSEFDFDIDKMNHHRVLWHVPPPSESPPKSSSRTKQKSTPEIPDTYFDIFEEDIELPVFRFPPADPKKSSRKSPAGSSSDSPVTNSTVSASRGQQRSQKSGPQKSFETVAAMKRLCVKKSRIHGFGLFAAFDFQKGDPVIEYVGELVRNAVADKLETIYEARSDGMNSCYFFRLDESSVVDATVSGNAARFINHSCSPNCECRVVNENNSSRIVIFAKHEVAAGEEFTYNYQFGVEGEDKILVCGCGAKDCVGRMN